MNLPILVVGDYIDDRYRWCRCERLCPEGPVPVLIVDDEEFRPGGAGNVFANLQSLSDNHDIAEFSSMSHSTKIRYFVGNHLMFREDLDWKSTLNGHENNVYRLTKILSEQTFRAVIVSDYGKGGLTDALVQMVLFKRTRAPIFVDAKNCHTPATKYKGAFCMFPNKDEHLGLEGSAIPSHIKHVVRKLGPEGCIIDANLHIKTKPQPVFDVTGAGDVFIAAFVLRYLEHLENNVGTSEDKAIEDAAYSANVAAGISVRTVGTCAVPREQWANELVESFSSRI